jgi:hypothetical protein
VHKKKALIQTKNMAVKAPDYKIKEHNEYISKKRKEKK